jgi:DNA-binding NarL/FixJ family response regulator
MNRSLQSKAKCPSVLIIDSLELRRAGVVSFLMPWAEDSGITLVPIDPQAALALAESHDSLVKLVLLVLGSRGIAETQSQDWISSLHDKYAGTPLVFLSEREEPEEVVAAFKAGAQGFIPLSATPPMAMQAFTFIMGGGSFFPPTALIRTVRTETIVEVVRTRDSTVPPEAQKCGLTARQQEVLERLRQGESNKLIGRQLKLRESTVKVHIRQIMRKLGATNRTQAALCAAQLGLATDKSVEADGDDSEFEHSKGQMLYS